MQKIKIINFVMSIIGILILSNVLSGSLTFGYGLGDWGMIFIFGGIFLLIIIINVITRKFKNIILRKTILIFLFVSSIITYFYLFMGLTFWRGSEYPWNNEITFPSRIDIYKNEIFEKRYDNKIDSISKLLIKNDKNIDLYIARARLYDNKRLLNNAIADYHKALQIDKRNFSANFEIGALYWEKEDLKNALKYNEIALSIDTSYFYSKHRVKMIKEEIKKNGY